MKESLYPSLLGSYHFSPGEGRLFGGGDQNFLRWSKGGASFFSVGQWGNENSLSVKEGEGNFCSSFLRLRNVLSKGLGFSSQNQGGPEIFPTGKGGNQNFVT